MLRQIKWMPIALILLLLFLQYRLWFDSGGIIDLQRLKKELASKTQENNQLKSRNDDLIKQIQSLQANDDAVESRARQELGMIKKGETYYQVLK